MITALWLAALLAADPTFTVVPLQASDAAAVAQACVQVDWFRNHTVPGCYPNGWQDWVKSEFRRIAPKPLLTSDGDIPPLGFLRFPDGSRHLVFLRTRRSINLNSAYWLVDPKGKRVNVVWVRSSTSRTIVECFGPDAALLKKTEIEDLLDEAVQQ